MHPYTFGLVLDKDDENIYVGYERHWLDQKSDIFFGRKMQKINLGDRFWTNESYLEESKKTRVYYMQKEKNNNL